MTGGAATRDTTERDVVRRTGQLFVLEAALCGCALVLGDIRSLREVWGPAASYVDPDDAETLAGTLNALLDDPARRHAAALAAVERASRYTPTAMA